MRHMLIGGIGRLSVIHFDVASGHTVRAFFKNMQFDGNRNFMECEIEPRKNEPSSPKNNLQDRLYPHRGF